jgi:hypothetical protein
MKHAIITCSDSRYGDFLINHWLKSLKDNVNLNNTDVVVLDYGLSDSQVRELSDNKVIIVKCIKDGHVTSIRYRDMEKFLSNNKYDQVMSVDGGDIIFQEDISTLFKKNTNVIRAACEDLNLSFDTFFSASINKKYRRDIKKKLKGKKMINGGLIIGSRTLIVKLCNKYMSMMNDFETFGADQVIINYLLYINDFVELDNRYNFTVTTSKRKFNLKDGVFYFNNCIKIPVVHNSGNLSACRTIDNFGYGTEFNKIKYWNHFLLKSFYSIVDSIRQLSSVTCIDK